MIAGGSNGRVELYDVSLAKLGTSGGGITHQRTFKIGPESLGMVRISPPGVVNATVRIQSVQFATSGYAASAAPITSGTFLATFANSTVVWDVEKGMKSSVQTSSSDAVRKAVWSPHSPQATLIASGGVGRQVNVFDTRMNSSDGSSKSAWRVENAHDLSITDVQFNPFIPYWLASSGEDCAVKIWDLRYKKHPAARIDGHYRNVNSMAWSLTHAEVLSSGSADCTWRAFSFNQHSVVPRHLSPNAFVGCPASEWNGQDAERILHENAIAVGAKLIGESWDGATAPVIDVKASPTHADAFYSLSAVGEVSVHTLRSELWEQLTQHTFAQAKNPCEHEVECKVYAREMTSAYQAYLQASKSHRPSPVAPVQTTIAIAPRPSTVSALSVISTTGTTVNPPAIGFHSNNPTPIKRTPLVVEHEGHLIDLCTPRGAVEPESWKFPNCDENTDLVKGKGTKKINEAEESSDHALEQNPASAFKGDLTLFTKFLPPKYGEFTQWLDMIPPKQKLEFELAVLRYNIVQDSHKGAIQSILNTEKMVIKGMEADPTYMDGETLTCIVEAILPLDFARGLSFAVRIAEVFEDTPSRNFVDLAEMLLMLIFPTVYDDEVWLGHGNSGVDQGVKFDKGKDPNRARSSMAKKEDPAKSNANTLIRCLLKTKEMQIKKYIEFKHKGLPICKGSEPFIKSPTSGLLPATAPTPAVTAMKGGSALGHGMDTSASARPSVAGLGPGSGGSGKRDRSESLGTKDKKGGVVAAVPVVNGAATMDEWRTMMFEVILSNPKLVMFMIKREMSLLKIATKSSETMDEEVIRLFTAAGLSAPSGSTASSSEAKQGGGSTASSPSGVGPTTTALSGLSPPGPSLSPHHHEMKRSASAVSTLSTVAGPKQSPSFLSGTKFGAGTANATAAGLADRTISAHSNRVHLEALLAKNRFEELFSVGIDLLTLCVPYDFAHGIFRLMDTEALPKLRTHIDSLHKEANSFLEKAGQAHQQQTSGMTHPGGAAMGSVQAMTGIGATLVNGTKVFKTGLTVAVRVGAVLAQAQDTNGKLLNSALIFAEGDSQDSKFTSFVERVHKLLTQAVVQLSPALFSMLETMERILGRAGDKGTYTKEAAQTIREVVMESLRLFPRSASERRAAVSSIASSQPLYEELASVGDRLNKYINPIRSVAELQ
ncbi:hypothetical protein BJ742DRAFT_900286 [Cladochytrium replicatum]|nr:hypothetical protein BJ742DRAFT_900286 [Cladochytrium replicatum]